MAQRSNVDTTLTGSAFVTAIYDSIRSALTADLEGSSLTKSIIKSRSPSARICGSTKTTFNRSVPLITSERPHEISVYTTSLHCRWELLDEATEHIALSYVQRAARRRL